jgi:hypothetical protein
MVMRLKAEKNKVLTSLWLVLGVSLATSACYASSFYTIIGPDGHPMIIQKPEASTKTETKPKNNEKKETQTIKSVEPVPIQSSTQLNQNNHQPEYPQTVTPTQVKVKKDSPVVNHPSVVQQKPQNNDHVSPQPATPLVKPTEQAKKVVSFDEAKQVDKTQQLVEPNKVDQPNLELQASKAVNVVSKTQNTQALDDQNFTIIDGEKYVNNEYLEDREFNLEGKKRFYMTPEVGAVHGRYETIERQKGLSTSLLNRIRGNDKTEEKKPVVLSSTYFRLPKDEVVQNLEQACFTGKKVVKAKGLSFKNQEIGLWPVAPIKENFAYEVVKLDAQVQNILLTSYASSSKTQTYYWPLVVFLDAQGCIIEGVSGFKNEESSDNNLQYAAMEGVLRKPEKATYLFLTPLSSAIDVENKQLTNHGQIKLSVIQ